MKEAEIQMWGQPPSAVRREKHDSLPHFQLCHPDRSSSFRRNGKRSGGNCCFLAEVPQASALLRDIRFAL